MERITIYPKNEKQKSLLTSLLQEMRIRFVIDKEDEHSHLSEEEFKHKIDQSILQAEEGKTKYITKDNQDDFLGI